MEKPNGKLFFIILDFLTPFKELLIGKFLTLHFINRKLISFLIV